MVETPSLPAYSPAYDRPPPAYTAPTTYTIGGRKTAVPLVHVDQLKAHLDLLRAFHGLREAVEKGDDGRFPVNVRALEGCQRWVWFLELAVERFRMWAASVQVMPIDEWVQDEVPPLDVWMVWHAYLLNPIWYAEDCHRLPALQGLKKLGDWFLPALTAAADLPSSEPSSQRKASWLQRTGTPFDPLAAASEATDLRIECPKCRAEISVACLQEDGSGYVQRGFKVTCGKCSLQVTKEKLGIAKFVRDLCKDPRDDRDVAEYGDNVYLAGSLHTQTEITDSERAQKVREAIMNSPTFDKYNVRAQLLGAKEKADKPAANELWAQHIMKSLDYSLKNTQSAISARMKPKLVNRIMSAYSDGRPFSIELVGAVLRQGSFVEKMHNFRWTEQGYFDDTEDEVVLVHAIARYHAFLDLMACSAGMLLVPTLDIDLAWHTHQLMGPGDDKIEENHLATSFDLTCRAWERRFSVPYMHCGCPLPGDTIGQRLNRLSQKVLSRPSQPGALQPPPRPDALSATHPSDHNSVYSPHGHSEHMRQSRAEKARRRRERDAQRLKRGKLDEAAYRRGEAHDMAFLVPVPFFYTPSGCVGPGPPGML
ncbi:hypothetical protein A0H81_06345 [Grifola frondosa]|uniref:Uncharacterized protein n=1 Tax=Grifola frondosa TaxID=5627 RepID=A0A1C7MAH6_GRIFR|nr:hypothetical protein A0H81_06345 [Grifola frondosa]